MENLQQLDQKSNNSVCVRENEKPPPARAPVSDTPRSDTPLRRGPRRRIDWTEVATMLADGVSTLEVAHQVGCSRQHVWRILRSSNALRLRLGEERARVAAECGAQIEGLRRTIADKIEREVYAGNIRVLLWAADRLGLTAHALPSRRLPDLPPEPLDTEAPYFDDALEPDFSQIQPETQTVGVATGQANQADKSATDAHRCASSPISPTPTHTQAAKIERGPKSATRKRPKPPAPGARTR
jgi:transcriptional regulator with XRE-family HTH domain